MESNICQPFLLLERHVCQHLIPWQPTSCTAVNKPVGGLQLLWNTPTQAEFNGHTSKHQPQSLQKSTAVSCIHCSEGWNRCAEDNSRNMHFYDWFYQYLTILWCYSFDLPSRRQWFHLYESLKQSSLLDITNKYV